MQNKTKKDFLPTSIFTWLNENENISLRYNYNLEYMNQYQSWGYKLEVLPCVAKATFDHLLNPDLQSGHLE